MPYIDAGKENDKNIKLHYKDWGKGQPVVFSHGWPLSADAWESQMFFSPRTNTAALGTIAAAMADRASQSYRRQDCSVERYFEGEWNCR